MDPRLRAFFAPQLNSEGLFPWEKVPPKATVDEKMDTNSSDANPSEPDSCDLNKAPLKPDAAPLAPENSGSDDEAVIVTVASKIIPNFISNEPIGPFLGIKNHFTYDPQLLPKKTLFYRPKTPALANLSEPVLAPEPQPKPKRERPDPLPKLLEFMKFESILSEELREDFASKLQLKDLIGRSSIPNAALLQWLWPMKEHIVAQWDSMEGLPRAQKLEALRKVKQAVQLKMKVEKADRVCQYLLANEKKKKKLKRPPELEPTEDQKRARLQQAFNALGGKNLSPIKMYDFLNWARKHVPDFEPEEAAPAESINNTEVVAQKGNVDEIQKEAHSDPSHKSTFVSEDLDLQLFVNKFYDEKNAKSPLPPDDPGVGELKSSADGPNGFLKNEPVRPPPPAYIFRDPRKRRSRKRSKK
jgi:hypothetical protein